MSNTSNTESNDFNWSREEIDQWFDTLNAVGQQTIRKMMKLWVVRGYDEHCILGALNIVRTLVEEEKLDVNNQGMIPLGDMFDIPGINHEPTDVDKIMMAGWTVEKMRALRQASVAERLEFEAKKFPKYYQRLWEESLPAGSRMQLRNIRGESDNCGSGNNYNGCGSGGSFFDSLMKFGSLATDYMRGKQEARIVNNLDMMGSYQKASYQLQHEAAKKAGVNIPAYLSPDSIR